MNDVKQLSARELPGIQDLRTLVESEDYSSKITTPGKCATVRLTFFAGKGHDEISTGYAMTGSRAPAYHMWDVQVLGINHKKHCTDYGVGESKGWVETYKAKFLEMGVHGDDHGVQFLDHTA